MMDLKSGRYHFIHALLHKVVPQLALKHGRFLCCFSQDLFVSSGQAVPALCADHNHIRHAGVFIQTIVLAPVNDVTDMDLINHPEWSSYHVKIPSRVGRHLFVVSVDYDDVKSNDPERLYNPRYNKPVGNNWKYNLSLLKIDLQTHAVENYQGESVNTPIDIETTRAKCQIWDTEWRGAGVPPAISLNDKGMPELLHVLSEDDLETHSYYYVRYESGEWMQTRITASNHQWNSAYLKRDKDGQLHAYVTVGEGYLANKGIMDSHGGGRIEHWLSKDGGHTWKKHRDITPDPSQYAGWRFNNVQPILMAVSNKST